MEHVDSLDVWFDNALHGLRCDNDTRAYVAGVLAGFGTRADGDLSNESIVLMYNDARVNGDFSRFQRIGDWVLWVSTLYPKHVAENITLVETIGRLSYYSCHRILRREWKLYEELAEDLPRIARDARNELNAYRFSTDFTR